MLELKQITKDYPAGEDVVHALKGVSITFRESEFVSVLGPSGCGKTTLLNIIGGLDGYNEGDLVINGKSTKDFKDRDWDAYRNHSVGFVFQSYNLIPHQTVLQNVEIALTLSGVPKAERHERAKKALEEVGLGNQLNKRPNQMSGGQMQRVAIARALVNNPDIILADEPTGALDTETSVQVMEILKEVSKDRLVVMVTHNPELAEKYSSRIIRMLDGEITHDSAPIGEEEYAKETEQMRLKAEQSSQAEFEQPEQTGKKPKKEKKPTMSFWTAFRLSLKNLFTKKGRTILTAFAGSIGIIGIALILAVSQGMTGYINTVQEETLSSYPVAIEAESTDLTSLIKTFMNPEESKPDHGNDAVYQRPLIYNLANSIASVETKQNDLKSFKSYLDAEVTKENSKLSSAVAGVQYAYDLDLLVYTQNEESGEILRSDVSLLMEKLLNKYLGAELSSSSTVMNNSMLSMLSMGTTMSLWQELLPAKDGGLINPLLKRQYDVVYGNWPARYDEIVLVLDENNEIDDMSLYILGLLGNDVIDDAVDAVVNHKPIEVQAKKWTYEEICKTEVKTILNADCYSKDEETGLYNDLRENDLGLRYLYDNALDLKITGIIKPNEKATSTMLSGTVCYTSELTKHVIEKSRESEAAAAQLESKDIDIVTGLPFKSTTGSLSAQQKKNDLKAYINTLDFKGKAEIYEKIKCIMPKNDLVNSTTVYMSQFSDKDALVNTIAEYYAASTKKNKDEIVKVLVDRSEEDLKKMMIPFVQEGIKKQHAETEMKKLEGVTNEQKVERLNNEILSAETAVSDEEFAQYYDEVMEFSPSSYEQNLIKMGYIDLDNPSAINIYASSFKDKDVIADAIKDYNKTVDEDKQIKYTDYVAMMMSAVTTIINAITYVLIAFVAISLIVSSIMVGVITLISVQERTKEIGILRAIGASKRDVSSMFNAETIIIGFAAGLFGVLVTYLLCIPINIILHVLTGIKALNAFLHPVAALILIAISVLLTLISGLIPSRSAAKKDPVVALRTE